MTGQIPDKVIFNGDLFDLVGVKGEGLYEPFDFGLVPISPHTANWRGFVSTYEISKNVLLLKELEVNIKDEDQSYPEINGVKPESRKENLVHLDYKNINLKTIYTGTLLIAKDFIDSMYVHMGFQSPLSFEIILEVKFKEGKLINQENVSDLIKEYREKDYTDGKLGPQDDDYMKWIERTFSLDYEI